MSSYQQQYNSVYNLAIFFDFSIYTLNGSAGVIFLSFCDKEISHVIKRDNNLKFNGERL